MTTVTVLVVVSGGTAAAVQMLPAAGGQTPPGTGPTTSSVPPSCPMGGAPVDPGPSPYLGPNEVVPVPNTGPLFYLQARPGPNASTLQLVSWTPGQSGTVARRELPADAGQNANVSPDGRWVSWVTIADGALHIAALDGDKAERVLRSNVDGWQLEPVWARDSTRLLIRDSSTGQVGTLTITGGRFTPLLTNLVGARHAVWSSDGSAIAFITPDGGIAVAKPDGTGQKRIPAVSHFAKDGRKVVSLQSMSGTTDGFARISLFVASAGKDPDGCRSLVSNTVVRTDGGLQGRDQAQRGGQYTPYQSVFRGSHFSHVSRRLDNQRGVALIGDNGEFWGGADEPAQLNDYLLLNN